MHRDCGSLKLFPLGQHVQGLRFSKLFPLGQHVQGLHLHVSYVFPLYMHVQGLQFINIIVFNASLFNIFFYFFYFK